MAGSERRRSVLHVITGLGTGGAETMLSQLVHALGKLGSSQLVVSLKDGGAHPTAIETAGVSLTALGVETAFGGPAAAIRLASIVNRMRPSIIQGWMYHGNLAALAAHKLAPGSSGRLLYWNLRASNMDFQRYRRIIGWNARLGSWPDRIIANSRAGCRFHLACGLRPKQLEMIPNGIDTEKFKPGKKHRADIRKELGISPDALLVIHVARVDPMKDHASFLAAMKLLPDLQAILVGLGTDRLTVPPNVRALGLRHDMPRLYAAADIFVLSSAYGEGFSNALGEAMSCGLVPVATNVGDAKVIIANSGVVVNPGNPMLLSKAIGELASSNTGRIKLGTRARQRILQNYTLAAAVQTYAEVYGISG